MDFKDTQCGAKIFHKDVINIAFSEKFVTQWIFDVEIFKRMSQYFGLSQAKSMLCEQPLKRWIHADAKSRRYTGACVVYSHFSVCWNQLYAIL